MRRVWDLPVSNFKYGAFEKYQLPWFGLVHDIKTLFGYGCGNSFHECISSLYHKDLNSDGKLEFIEPRKAAVQFSIATLTSISCVFLFALSLYKCSQSLMQK